MANFIQKPKGTQDVVPSQSYKWQTVERIVAETAEQFGFNEIRIPTFEETGLFVRSVGDTTDVVQKEMYTVSATGDSTFTLRPEGTAGTIRAMLENGILNEGFPQRAYYILSCFRHENVQKGRLREFHQFGVEMAGAADPAADADVIALAKSIIDRVGLKNIRLEINSIGCPECRAEYHKALKEYFGGEINNLCHTCHERFERNPMRILDCKVDNCKKIAEKAPVILDFLCDECKAHFEEVKENLTAMGIDYTINPHVVRGLDYYTRTVFEFITTGLGAQGAVCAGGRYDGLISSLGGPQTPALGFGMGLERIILTMEKQGCAFMEPKGCDLYIVSMGKAAQKKAMEIAMEMRPEGYYVQYDVVGRGLKPQMKYADKIGAKFVLVLGDSELESGEAKFRNMLSGEESRARLGERLIEDFGEVYYSLLLDTDEDFREFVDYFGGESGEDD